MLTQTRSARLVDNLPLFRQLGRMPAETTAAEVGQTIRAEMGRRRINMSELSRRTGISRTTLMHQIDVTRVTVDNLVAIARALDVPVSELVGEAIA